MKTVLFILAIVGLSQGASIAKPKSLTDDLQDFIDLLPTDEILNILINNLGDSEVQDVIVYLFSDEFKALVLEIEDVPEYETVISYLESAGLPVRDWIAVLHEFIGLSRKAHDLRNLPKGINDVIQQIIAILPIDEIRALYLYKVANVPEFAELVSKIDSAEFRALVDAIANNDEVKRLAQELRNRGVDIDAFLDLVRGIFGFNTSVRSTRALMDDLQDFIDLLPLDDILNILINSLGDSEVQDVIIYIFSDEFKQLVLDIEAIAEYEAVISYLDNAGLPVRDWIAVLHEFIGLSRSAGKSVHRGLNDVIQQIIAILPIDEIRALYLYKVANVPAFAELVSKLESAEFRALVDAIASNSEVIRLAQELRNRGIDIDAFLDLVKEIFGFNRSVRSTRALMDDLQDFIDLLPLDDILNILINSLGDSEVQDVIIYIFSDEFKQLVLDIEAIAEYEAVISYLDNAGLPVRDWIAVLHEFIGLSRSAGKSVHRGLNDVIQQIIAILPIDEIRALYLYKVANVPAFAELVSKLESAEFRALVDAIASNSEVIRLAQELRNRGIDIDAFLDLVKEIFGFNRSVRSTRALMDDLQDFIDLLPLDDILNILINSLGDSEVQDVIIYIFSDEFKQLVLDIEAIAEYEAVISYLDNAGLPVRDWIAVLHEFIGLSRSAGKSVHRGLNDVIQQIIAILPIDEIRALYLYKVANVPAFAELVSKLESAEFRALVDAIASNSEVIRLAQELRNRGIDIDAFLDLVKEIFGFNRSVRSTRALMDDLQDFIDLLPLDDILNILINSLGDSEVQDVIIYIFSDEFKQLVLDIEAIAEYEAVISYLDNAGLPVRDWIAVLHEFIGLSRSAGKSVHRGLNDVIQQIIAILPIDEIRALYLYKVANVPAFAELVSKLESAEFRALVDAIASNSEVIRLAQELRNRGIDIDAFLDLVKEIFGFNRSVRSTRALMDDLQDFIDLLPLDDILNILINSLGDSEVQDVIIYIFSDEFKQLVLDIEAIAEYEAVISYLDNAGLPVRDWIAVLHEFIGLSRSAGKSVHRGLNDVIQQIIAILPIDEIRALYLYKVANVPAFAELVSKLESAEFRALVDAIASNAEIVRLAQELRNRGIDIDAFLDLVKEIFGFN